MNQTTYIAYDDDLYRIVFTPSGDVVEVEREDEEHNVVELSYWDLPSELKDRIDAKIERLLE